MSRKAVFLAFDGVIEGASSVYSDAALNDALGEYDQLGLQAISDLINGTSPTLTVQIYHTCDPRQGMDAIWTTKNGHRRDQRRDPHGRHDEQPLRIGRRNYPQLGPRAPQDHAWRNFEPPSEPETLRMRSRPDALALQHVVSDGHAALHAHN